MKSKLAAVAIALITAVWTIFGSGSEIANPASTESDVAESIVISESERTSENTCTPANYPVYSGEDYITINNNKPDFTTDEVTSESYEFYSELDDLGRCGYAIACVGQDIMPTEKRGSIGMIKPSGWHTVRYDDLISDKYLYNRCHLIGYQLTGENANELNLITGTRYFNVTGMLPFEDEVADYVHETNNHVMYRVTPDFEGDNLVAYGVQMEAYSVEDNGQGVCYNVFVYNIQPNITIDYATGDSWRTNEAGSRNP